MHARFEAVRVPWVAAPPAAAAAVLLFATSCLESAGDELTLMDNDDACTPVRDSCP